MQEASVQLFSHEQFGELRITQDDNGNPLFCAKDVATALGYANPTKAVRDRCKGGLFSYPLMTEGGIQKVRFITEGDMYRLVCGSRLESAARFEGWVFDEVLPSIRRDGYYATPGKDEEIRGNAAMVQKMLADPRSMISVLEAYADTMEDNRRLSAENDEMRPKALFADSVAKAEGDMLVREFAKILRQSGYDTGERRLYRWLRDNGYLISRGRDRNRPTQRAADLGLFRVVESTRTGASGEVHVDRVTLVTGKGQVYLANKFRESVASASA